MSNTSNIYRRTPFNACNTQRNGIPPRSTCTYLGGTPPASTTVPLCRRMTKGATTLALASVLSLSMTTMAAISPANALDLRPHGIDVSSHQHPFGTSVNWWKVRLAGYSFAIIKATEGTGYVNPYFEENRTNAHLAGMIVGSYHYARPNQDPVAQALHYADTIKCQKIPLEFPPVLDIETTGGLHPILLNGWTAVFLNTLNLRCATNTIVYTYPHFWRTAMWNSPLFTFSPLWIADYNGSDGPTRPLPGAWMNWNIWQYSSRGRVPGVNAAVDLNIFNGGYVGLAAFSARMNSVPTVPTVKVKGKWQVDPTYWSKARLRAKKGLPISPVMRTPESFTGSAVPQATVKR